MLLYLTHLLRFKREKYSTIDFVEEKNDKCLCLLTTDWLINI